MTKIEKAKKVRDAFDQLRDEAATETRETVQNLVDALDSLTVGETAKLYDLFASSATKAEALAKLS